jgi:hypothetical protein
VGARLADPVSEGAALGADETEDLGTGAGGARRMRLALLGLGPAPFEVDLRWTLSARVRARPDGVVLVRYDLDPEPPPERVSVFAGVAVVEPWGAGSRWTEVVAIGSPTTPPPLLGGSAADEATRLLGRRATRLAAALR